MADLTRIHRRGLREHGEAQADEHYNAFSTASSNAQNSRCSILSSTKLREGYRRSVCGPDSIYFRNNVSVSHRDSISMEQLA